MCFDIFFELNEFLEEVEKLFVGAGEGVTRPYKWHFSGTGHPPLKMGSPVSKNAFSGTGRLLQYLSSICSNGQILIRF